MLWIMRTGIAALGCSLALLVTMPSAWAQDFVWARGLGGTPFAYDFGEAVAVDAGGNVYTVGTFHGTVDFDPGPGTYNLTAVGGGGEVFISKLDNDGNFVWARQLGGTSHDAGLAVAVDAGGNVYSTGVFYGTADFDPGPGTYNLTPAGANDLFISKLDNGGNFVWARGMGGSSFDVGSYDVGYAVAVDAGGSVYTAGVFSGTADFDPGPGTYNLTSAGGNDGFVSKLDNGGNFVWARQLGGSSGDYGLAVAVDAGGNVYTTGTFAGTADFDPGGGTHNLTSAGDYDIFISKLDNAGNFVWARGLGEISLDQGQAVAVDAGGNVYTVGDFRGTVDFDPGPGTYNLTSAGTDDVFISKLDNDGNFVWAGQLGGIFSDAGIGVAVDAGGNVYTTGYFSNAVDFDPGPGTYNLTSAGEGDVFISKLDNVGNFAWALRWGGISEDEGFGVAVDTGGNVYATGAFGDTVDFDPGPGTYNLTSPGLSSIFISKLGCGTAVEYHVDLDGDGYGDPAPGPVSCTPVPDYVADGTDCDDTNHSAWATPSEVASLWFTDDTTLAWSTPVEPGGAPVHYDVRRVGHPTLLAAPGRCLAGVDAGTTVTDTEVPPTGSAFFYLVAARSACPSGQGPWGYDSSGNPIDAASCP
jgi:hypothetical protein